MKHNNFYLYKFLKFFVEKSKVTFKTFSFIYDVEYFLDDNLSADEFDSLFWFNLKYEQEIDYNYHLNKLLDFIVDKREKLSEE